MTRDRHARDLTPTSFAIAHREARELTSQTQSPIRIRARGASFAWHQLPRFATSRDERRKVAWPNGRTCDDTRHTFVGRCPRVRVPVPGCGTRETTALICALLRARSHRDASSSVRWLAV